MTERESRPDIGDDPTGITSLSTKALLQGLIEDVRAARAEVRDMRGELASVSGVVVAIQDRQRDLAATILEQNRRFSELESAFREHQARGEVWQVKQEAEVGKLATQLGLVAPLTAAHEQYLQQARGAVIASKLLYTVLGVIGGGGVVKLITMFGGH